METLNWQLYSTSPHTLSSNPQPESHYHCHQSLQVGVWTKDDANDFIFSTELVELPSPFSCMFGIETSIIFPFCWPRVGRNWRILRQKEEFSSLRFSPPLLHPLFVNTMARLVKVMNLWLSLSPCLFLFWGLFHYFPFPFQLQSSHSQTDQLFINAHTCPIWLLPACVLLTFLHFSSGSICFLLFNTNKTFVLYTSQALMSLGLPLRFLSPRMPGEAPRQCLSIILVWQRRPQVWERYWKKILLSQVKWGLA